MDNKIPTSVLIADARNKLNEVLNHPLLSPQILELIFKDAWQKAAIKAQAQLAAEYEEYIKENGEKEESEVEE